MGTGEDPHESFVWYSVSYSKVLCTCNRNSLNCHLFSYLPSSMSAPLPLFLPVITLILIFLGDKSKSLNSGASPRAWNILVANSGSFFFLTPKSLSLGGLGKFLQLDYLFSSFMLPVLSWPHLNHVIGKSNWKGNLILPCVASLHILFRSVMDLSASFDEVQSQW